MKSNVFTICLVGLLVFSCLGLALANVVCPTCNGAGSIPCPKCGGTGTVSGIAGTICGYCSGTGTLTPKVSMVTIQAGQHDGATFITGVFHNKETFDVNGTVTASLDTHTKSQEVTFPAGQDTSVTLQIDYVGNYATLSQSRLMQNSHISVSGIADVTCPYCSGTGTVYGTTTCTTCKGAGIVSCPTCKGAGFVDEAALANAGGVTTVAIEAIVAVVAAAGCGIGGFMVLKKRRVSEKSIRRFSSREFNDWVLGRLDGKAPSSRDTAMGIDGYTGGGQPVIIKQSDGVGMTVIDSFAAALARNKARNGVIVAYSFGGDAVRGKVRAQVNYKLQIEMLTVKELIENKRIL